MRQPRRQPRGNSAKCGWNVEVIAPAAARTPGSACGPSTLMLLSARINLEAVSCLLPRVRRITPQRTRHSAAPAPQQAPSFWGRVRFSAAPDGPAAAANSKKNPGRFAPAGVAMVMPDQALGTWIRTTSSRTLSGPPKTVSFLTAQRAGRELRTRAADRLPSLPR